MDGEDRLRAPRVGPVSESTYRTLFAEEADSAGPIKNVMLTWARHPDLLKAAVAISALSLFCLSASPRRPGTRDTSHRLALPG